MVNGDTAVNVELREMSISGNMPYDFMAETKIKWATDDDHLGPSTVEHLNVEDGFILLQQQRIRVFEVTYTPLA